MPPTFIFHRVVEAVMVDLIAVGVVVAGVVLLFGGAALSVYGVALLGALVGGGGGYLVAPTLGGLVGVEGLAATAVAVAIGGIAGIAIAYTVLSMAVAAISLVVGVFLGLVVFAPILVDGAWYVEWAAAIGVGLVAAVLAMFLTKTTLIFISAATGAALASLSVTPADVAAAAEATSIDPLLFDATAPLFLGLLVLGVLSQFGLFKLGYVTKLAALLPGASVLRDKGDEEGSAET